jgi:hypothetical protein
MPYFTGLEIGVFITLFLGNFPRFMSIVFLIPFCFVFLFLTFPQAFFILAFCVFKYLHERRLRNRLQNELNSLLYEYVAMDDNSDVETITFFNSSGITGQTKDKEKKGSRTQNSSLSNGNQQQSSNNSFSKYSTKV